jgi:hypothetical protein
MSEIEISQHTKLILLDMENREKLMLMQALCEECDMPIFLSAADYHTMTRLVVTNHPKRPEWEEYFLCCGEECYRKADKKIGREIERRCGEDFIMSIEKWSDDE